MDGILQGRSQASFVQFKNRYLIVYGGCGDFMPQVNVRETFIDLSCYDLKTKKVVDLHETSY